MSWDHPLLFCPQNHPCILLPSPWPLMVPVPLSPHPWLYQVPDCPCVHVLSAPMDTHLLSNIQKLFSERIDIFSPVEFNKVRSWGHHRIPKHR